MPQTDQQPSHQPSRQRLATASQLGQVLHASRKAAGLSQAELASKLGISQSRVSRLELNPEDLSLQQLLAWCAALGLELAVAPKAKPSSPTATTDW